MAKDEGGHLGLFTTCGTKIKKEQGEDKKRANESKKKSSAQSWHRRWLQAQVGHEQRWQVKEGGGRQGCFHTCTR